MIEVKVIVLCRIFEEKSDFLHRYNSWNRQKLKRANEMFFIAEFEKSAIKEDPRLLFLNICSGSRVITV